MSFPFVFCMHTILPACDSFNLVEGGEDKKTQVNYPNHKNIKRYQINKISSKKIETNPNMCWI